MSKLGFIQDAFCTTVVFIFTTVVLSEKFSDRATTVVFYYSGFKIRKITLVRRSRNVTECVPLLLVAVIRDAVFSLTRTRREAVGVEV